MMPLLNMLACAILFACSSWAILSPNFNDGLIMKKALILIALSSMAGVLHSSDPHFTIPADAVVLNSAFAMMALSMVLRRFTRPVWRSHDRKPRTH